MHPYEYESDTQRAERIWRLCQACARSVYPKQPPLDEYALATARLLFGTAAAESELALERQTSPSYWGEAGAFSKWQVECGSIEDSLARLRANPDLADRATQWLFNAPKATASWLWWDDLKAILLFALRLDDNDKLGVLFARLHYLRDRHAIPLTLHEQAKYYKRVFNTEAGAATVAGYLRSWKTLCEPVAGAFS